MIIIRANQKISNMEDIYNIEPKKSIKELVEIAKDISKHNGGNIVFSGSFALKLQGFDIKRDCGDLDIITDNCHVFDMPKNMKKTDEYLWLVKDYDEDEDNETVRPYEIQAYKIKGVKVDLFTPNFSKVFHSHEVTLHHSGIKLPLASEILKFKVSHALGTAKTRFKHRDDIIYFMTNNVD